MPDTKEDLKRYGWSVAAVAAAICFLYYIGFTVAMLLSPDAGTMKDRAGVALVYLFVTPMTLAGGWYLTVPAILILGWALWWSWPKLPVAWTSWRPHKIWQHILVGVAVTYGGLSVLILAICTPLAIPDTLGR